MGGQTRLLHRSFSGTVLLPRRSLFQFEASRRRSSSGSHSQAHQCAGSRDRHAEHDTRSEVGQILRPVRRRKERVLLWWWLSMSWLGRNVVWVGEDLTPHAGIVCMDNQSMNEVLITIFTPWHITETVRGVKQ